MTIIRKNAAPVTIIFVLAVLFAVSWNSVMDSANNLASINEQHRGIRLLLDTPDAKAESVSKWTVYQQIEHMLRANSRIAEFIAAGTAPSVPEKRSLLGTVLLLTGFIPRGRAKSPEFLVPSGKTREELVQMLDLVEQSISSLPDEARTRPTPVGNHPRFGALNAVEWLRFIEMHNRHHLKIVADIKAAAGSR